MTAIAPLLAERMSLRPISADNWGVSTRSDAHLHRQPITSMFLQMICLTRMERYKTAHRPRLKSHSGRKAQGKPDISAEREPRKTAQWGKRPDKAGNDMLTHIPHFGRTTSSDRCNADPDQQAIKTLEQTR